MTKQISNERLKEVFDVFLAEYLENVQRELPTSYRAQQLRNGGTEAALVYEFETRFLKKPFVKAIGSAFGLASAEKLVR